LGLCGFDEGCGGELCLDIVVQLAVSDRFGFRQRCIPLHIQCCLAKLCLGLRKLCLDLVERCLEGARIDLEKHLALLYE